MAKYELVDACIKVSDLATEIVASHQVESYILLKSLFKVNTIYQVYADPHEGRIRVMTIVYDDGMEVKSDAYISPLDASVLGLIDDATYMELRNAIHG